MKSAPKHLSHRIEGTGETVLMLNGGFMTYATWQGVAKHLRPAYRLLFCDLKGQPLSPGPSHDELVGNVADVVDLLDRLQLDSVHVLSTSFGSWVGILLAATHPDRVLSLITVTTSDLATDWMVRGVEELRSAIDSILEGGDPGRFHDLLVRDVYSPEYVESHQEELQQRREQLARVPVGWFADLSGILKCTERIDLRSQLERIQCPTLVVHAKGDRVIPMDRSRALAAGIRGAELIEHPSSGHALVAEDPDWLGARSLEFLQEQQAKVAAGD